MTFAKNELLYLLWLLPLAGLLLVWAEKIRQKRLARFAALRLPELLNQPVQPRSRQRWQQGLFLAALTLMLLALARPRWGFEWRELPRGGLDLMVVLDLSTSMLATDIPPNRLERAKRELIDLLGLLQGDRLGIVAFAGVAFVQCPLTVDYRLAGLFINQLSTNLLPVQGTALGPAIQLATASLVKASDAASQGKAMILITDGEDQDGSALAAAQAAKAQGVRIYAIGIGKAEGAPIPLPEGGFKKDKAGNLVLSKLDEATLEEIALQTGGMYVRSTSGDLDLEQIYRRGIRAHLRDTEFGESRQKIWYERYQWFLAGGLALLLLEGALSVGINRKRRKRDAP